MHKLFPITHYEWMIRNNVELVIDKLATDLKNPKDLTFDEFAEYFSALPEIHGYFSMSGVNNVNLFARQFYHCYKMKCNGEKIYYMDKEVCNLLENTRLTIDAEFIEAPFEQIYIYTDQESLCISDLTGSQPVKGIYLQLTTELGKKYLRFIATSSAHLIESRNDVNYFATFEIPKHGNLEDIADNDMHKFIQNKTVLNRDVDLAAIRKMFIFCTNILLYIGCKNVDLINFKPENIAETIAQKKNLSKIKKASKLLERSSQMPFIIVTPKKGEGDKLGVSGTGSKLDHQVLVSGHWRGQWKGSQNNKTKEIIRIKSYVKGAELKKGENRPYLIK